MNVVASPVVIIIATNIVAIIALFRLFIGDSIPVEKLDAGSFEKIDIAFFGAGGDVSRNYVQIACQADAIAIDKSSAFRIDTACATCHSGD